MRRLLAALVLLAIAVVAAAFVLLRRGGASTPATVPTHAPRGRLDPGVLPRPGVYVYDQQGWEQAKAGPFKIRRNLPKRAVLVVGGSGNVVQEEWRYSKQHLEATRTRVTKRGRFSLWQRTKIVIVITDDEAHDARPVTLTQPAVLHVGQAWTQRYSVGAVRTVSRNRVTGRCPKTPDCLVLVADSTVSGPHPGTDRELWWESTKTGLALYRRLDRKIGGSTPYELHVTQRLRR